MKRVLEGGGGSGDQCARVFTFVAFIMVMVIDGAITVDSTFCASILDPGFGVVLVGARNGLDAEW